MSSHNSTAYCQSTSLLHTPSRNPALLREPSRCPGMSIFAHFHTENHSLNLDNACAFAGHLLTVEMLPQPTRDGRFIDRKSTRLNSSHSQISYAVFCLKKKLYCLLSCGSAPGLRLSLCRDGLFCRAAEPMST